MSQDSEVSLQFSGDREDLLRIADPDVLIFRTFKMRYVRPMLANHELVPRPHK